ncbi:MAG: Uma2 family endonuclease [Acetobacteraceae bacterium]
MSMALRQPMTLADFLAWEERQALRYEFDGFRPVAMTGGTSEHALIQSNLITALSNRLRGGPCRVFGSHLKIEAAGSIRYPDAFVVCSPLPRGTTVVSDPIVVFEIISPSTSGTDRIVKMREYGNTPSIQRYVILEQTQQAATVFSRQSSPWAAVVALGEEEIALPELGITLPLAELYQDVPLPPPPPSEDEPPRM